MATTKKLSLKILRATGLIAADNNLMTENSSDPYCQVWIGDNGENGGNQKETLLLQTPVQSQTRDPVWGGPKSLVELDLEEMQRRHNVWVTIKIYDKDVLSSDDPMGMVQFHPGRVMHEILANGEYPNVWRDLQPLDECTAPTGRLQFRLLPVHPPAAAAEPHQRNPLRESAVSSLRAGPKLKDSGVGRHDLPQLFQSSNTPVTLHVYDVGNDKRVRRINAVTKTVASGGIFHGAVEVHGLEYSFGGNAKNVTGIFACRPRQCPLHHYRESVFLGDCDLTATQVKAIIERLKPEWMAPTYNLLRKNCCSFSKEFAAELGVGDLPSWLYNLADYGAAWDDYLKAREAAKEEAKAKKEQGGDVVLQEEKKDESALAASASGEAGPDLEKSLSTDSTMDEGVEVSALADSVIITPLDHVMVVRVQRAFRNSSICSSSDVEVELS